MTVNPIVSRPQSDSQDYNTLEREYFAQFSAWESADYFAEGAEAWLIQCGVKPELMCIESETTCSAFMSIQDRLDLYEQPSDNGIYVLVDYEDDFFLNASRVYIWHIAEVAMFYAQGGE